MEKPLNEPDIYPGFSPPEHPAPEKRRRKRPATYLGVTCEGSGSEYRLRWVDPSSGKRTSQRLPPGLTAKEREQRRRTKAALLAGERAELERHADRKRHDGLTVTEAFAHYFRTKRPSKGTLAVYRPVAESFQAFCASQELELVKDVRRVHLRTWRSERLNASKQVAKLQGKRGEKSELGQRSAASANREMRALSAMLNYLRDEDVLHISSDEIRTGLAREKQAHHLREFLRAPHVRNLLQVASEQDRTTYALTRSGRKDVPRYKPIEPLLRCLVLTGLRIKEALGLRWEHVHTNEIHLPAEIAKGNRARVISLLESPTALPAQPSEAEPSQLVFGLTMGEAVAARKRLTKARTRFDYHTLRRTCATYSVNAPGLYGGAGVWLTAKRLGHSPAVLEKHYAGLVVGIDAKASTLEQVLGLDGAALATARAQVERAGEAHLDAIRADVDEQMNELTRKIMPTRVVPKSAE